LKLPVDERGRRRAANRAEWSRQVDKPLEIHDIFGEPAAFPASSLRVAAHHDAHSAD
jgi:hypothetical protein